MQTILGSGGVISRELFNALMLKQQRIRLVSRRALPVTEDQEVVAADLLQPDQVSDAIRGSDVVYLCAGLAYDHRIWAEQWPRIMDHVLEACKRHQARLVFFDNVYMYGRVEGRMTEESPYKPCSLKGETRARIATRLLEETSKGSLRALIARSADFYGPRSPKSLLQILVLAPFARQRKAHWLINDQVPHSHTFTRDAGKVLPMLAEQESSFGQVWHIPTAGSPFTGREWVEHIASAMGAAPRYSVYSRNALRLAGWFDRNTRESYEMLYQYEFPYIFDSTKFESRFPYRATPYEQGIRTSADWFKFNFD